MTTSIQDQYRMSDTRKPDGVHVVFRRECLRDWDAEMDFDRITTELSKERYEALVAGDWHFIGIRAVASITLVRNGVSITHELASAGLWGIESDSGEEYLEEVYRDEVCNLQADMMFMADMLAMADKLSA